MDRFMGDLPWDWRDRFRSTASGFFITGGSLNIRHLYIRQDMKVRFPLVENRFWLRFRYSRHQGLERDDEEPSLEFEAKPWDRWYVSLVGQPAFHKAESDAGVAVRFGDEEGRSLRATYLWPNFDANYAYHNRSVNEGFERFYNRFPQEARLAGSWIQAPWSLHAAGRWARAWDLEHRDFAPSAERYGLKASGSEGVLDLRRETRIGIVAAEAETWRARESISYEPARPAQDRAESLERNAARVSLERAAGSRSRIRAGAGFVHSRGGIRHPLDPPSDRAYRVLDRLAFAVLTRPWTPRLFWDAGYIYDRQWRERKSGGSSTDAGSRSQNRGLWGLRYDFAARGSFRVVTAWELDAAEAERFASFDGGTLQLLAVF
jgi:hypothetical protein